jgi:hypothetical protein
MKDKDKKIIFNTLSTFAYLIGSLSGAEALSKNCELVDARNHRQTLICAPPGYYLCNSETRVCAVDVSRRTVR